MPFSSCHMNNPSLNIPWMYNSGGDSLQYRWHGTPCGAIVNPHHLWTLSEQSWMTVPIECGVEQMALPLFHFNKISSHAAQAHTPRHDATYPDLLLLLCCQPLNLVKRKIASYLNLKRLLPCRTHVAITSDPFLYVPHNASPLSQIVYHGITTPAHSVQTPFHAFPRLQPLKPKK
jgi:hypothetical protein